MTDDSTGPVIALTKRHAAAAADLHAGGIDTGFLSSLGRGFLKQIYQALPRCPAAFGYVFQENGRVLGFIACTESTGGLYKQALKRRLVPMLWALKWHVLSPRKVRRMWQTLRYPAEVGQELPSAELLSIAVSGDARGKGVGKALTAAAVEEFRRRGVDRFRVAVGAAYPGPTERDRDEIVWLTCYSLYGMIIVEPRSVGCARVGLTSWPLSGMLYRTAGVSRLNVRN